MCIRDSSSSSSSSPSSSSSSVPPFSLYDGFPNPLFHYVLLRIRDQGNSPGHPFCMSSWSCAKRLD
eukprot:4331629-Pyramimonas_sp.AAC.1